MSFVATTSLSAVSSFVKKTTATLLLKASHREWHCVICFLWAKKLHPNAIHSKMRPVYDDKCFTRPAIHVRCKKFARGRENTADKKEPSRFIVSTTDRVMTAVELLIPPDRLTGVCKCLKNLDNNVDKLHVDV